ncbi:hypothetical protein HY415_02055 [Candidatus Kaiserbacteria bacterium]|nr:hypothetical protein [Candidatus Kaiserbacteria bacterium]
MQANSGIEGAVIELLQRGPLPILELIDGVDASRRGTTRQGVYRVLRKLRREEKIVIHGKSVSLNLQWLRRMSEYFSVAQYYYSLKHSNPDFFLNLEEREKISFTFKTLLDLDIFASHVIHMFAEIIGEHEPVFVFNPHEVFSYGRREAEKMLLKAMLEMKKQVFILSSRESPLDIALKKQFDGTRIQYHIEPTVPFDRGNYYFNVYGDYLLEITLDKNITATLEAFYLKTSMFDEQAEKELLEIFARKSRHKLIITKNKKKTDAYKRFFSKYFYTARH